MAEHPNFLEQPLGDVYRFYGAERVIVLDCMDFERGFDDEHPHLGFHPQVLQRLITQRDGAKLRKFFYQFWEKLVCVPTNVAKRGLALVGYCHGGKHRSNGIMAILFWCLMCDWQWLANFEVTMLSRQSHSWRKCEIVDARRKKGERCDLCLACLDTRRDGPLEGDMRNAFASYLRCRDTIFKQYHMA